MNLMLRDIPEDVMLKIDEQARKKHMSRNEYLKRLLCSEAQSPELKDMDEKYGELVDKALEENKKCRKAIEANTRVMEELLKNDE